MTTEETATTPTTKTTSAATPFPPETTTIPKDDEEITSSPEKILIAPDKKDNDNELTRTEALMESVLPECPTLDRICVASTTIAANTTGGPSLLDKEEEEEEDSPMASITNLKDPQRRIWVVTTAALPWRTGTAVNPLARALYLTDGRPSGYVTLVVPFLTSRQEQAKVFGKDLKFDTPDDQEAWIRQYCAERVHCPDKEKKMNILFYQATYNTGFGSIFASEDVCALIPREFSDICILEEPEHMNWMRVVATTSSTSKGVADTAAAAATTSTTPQNAKNGQATTEDATTTTTTTPATVQEEKETVKLEPLGWQVQFHHVVGILHTNYDAYARQYSMGAGFLAAGALHALSTMCVKAYCHKVIRLSDTLPTYDPMKEITCNVHGVRTEFLESADPNVPENQDTSLASIYFIGKLMWAKGFDKLLDIQEVFKTQTKEYFPIDVYGSGPDEAAIRRACFGRKGILQSSPNAPNVRDSTPDRTAKHIFDSRISLRDQLSTEEKPIEVVWDEVVDTVVSPTESMEQNILKAAEAAEVAVATEDPTKTPPFSAPSTPPPPLPLAVETTLSPTSSVKSPAGRFGLDTYSADFPNPFVILSDLSSQFVGTSFFATKAVSKIGQDTVGLGMNALSSEQSPTSSRSNSSEEEEGDAAMNVRSDDDGKASETGKAPSDKKSSSSTRRRLRFDPIKSRYELRRHPIPARFLGMKDHAFLRDLTRHKIFLNPSESEVLCTTSAEALAMGKFVILPKHPSNTFFLQFSNCLAYETKRECVQHIQWALANDPKPLSEEERFQLTWEGANARLFEAAAMTERQVEEWKRTRQEADQDAARMHYETVNRGRGVQKLLHRSIPTNILSRTTPKAATTSSATSPSSS